MNRKVVYAAGLLELVPESGGQEDSPPAGENRSGLPLLAYAQGQTLAQAVYLSGLFQPPVLCSGLACCGRCRVRIAEPCPPPVPADEKLFSPKELATGWRLACRHMPVPGMRLELPPHIRAFQEEYSHALPAEGKEQARPEQAAGRKYLLAVDLGTTTLHWRQIALVSLEGQSGEQASVVWQGSAVNPQMGAGSDVVARLAAAADASGRRRLRKLTLEALRGLADTARLLAGEEKAEALEALCLAANPAMTCIVLGLDTGTLATAPYSLPYMGGEWTEIRGLPRIWIPPQLSPFVGGDISAGYASLALDPGRPCPEFPFLLADLGTNGEFLLALGPEEAWSASVALGPALEGTGLSMGTEARPGAVARFTLSPKGIEAHCLPSGAGPCPGITGTGYISLLHILLQSGAVSREGGFCPENSGPLRKFFRLTRDKKSGEACLELPLGMRLPARDVEELLKVKAAFSLGLQRLLAHTGLASPGLAGIFVAGALGLHVDKYALEELGFFPPGMAGRIKAVGNSSLEGAELLLRIPDSRVALTAWAGKTKSLDLASDPLFLKGFARHMRFSWQESSDA